MRPPAFAVVAGGLLVIALFSVLVVSTKAAEPLRTSVISPLAERSLLLDIATAGDAAFAVGERGHVLKSVDQGQTWRQIEVPTRATLTAVAFLDSSLGFIAGHDAVILRSLDGGDTWQRVHYAPEGESPLLDIYIHNKSKIVAVGAYGLYLQSGDGGSNWSSRELVAVDFDDSGIDTQRDWHGAEDFHLNQIAVSTTGRWYLAAEAGVVYRSDDEGAEWRRLPSPYEGSFFGVLPMAADQVLLFGLQGRLFYSVNAGEAWRHIDTGTEATLTNALILRGGGIVVTGYSGSMLVSGRRKTEFALNQLRGRMNVASSIEMPDGDLILLGTGGMLRVASERITATLP